MVTHRRSPHLRLSVATILVVLSGLAALPAVFAEPTEEDYYRIITYPVPEDLKLEATGLATLPDGRLAVSIRKGEVWILENPLTEEASADAYTWKRFASGLHEPLGLTWHDGALYSTQRTEVTRMEDNDGDDVADAYLTAAKGWGVSGNYHEYAYGPIFDKEGNMWITLNINIGKGQEMPGFRGAEDVRWRGWAMMKPPGGKLQPMAAGLRSPLGLGMNLEGDVFATDQQGNYWAAGPLLHLRKGVFFGHADSLRDVDRPESPVKDPGELPKGATDAEIIDSLPGYQPPAVWFPYDKIGMSTTSILCDSTDGKFGPFAGQMFIGEFTQSFVTRVFLEKVEGEYQGACFHFRKGMQCAVISQHWLPDGTMVLGESNRGWNSLGTRSYGMQRLVWTGKTPFEIQKMEARPNGFRLTFTLPVEAKTAGNPASYDLSSYTYEYASRYGGDPVNTQTVKIASAKVSEDGMSVLLECEGLRKGHVHELHAAGVRSDEKNGGLPLLHAEAFYNLTRIPKE